MDIGILNKTYLYLNCGNKSIVIQNRYTLSEKVKGDELTKALQNIIDRFHYFKLKPVINKNGNIDFVKNNADLNVYEFDNKVHFLGTKEVNGYLFRISFQGNNIYISVSHAIADGRGTLLFGCSLIYEYLKIIGKKIDFSDEIITNETPINETETDTLELNELDRREKFGNEEPYVLPVNYQYYKTEYEKKTVISWNAEKFSDLIHQLGCTPVTLITTIIGNAIYKNYDVKKKKVLVSIPVDLRPFYQSKAQANFFTGIKLEYKEEYINLPLKEQLNNIQKALEEQLSIKNLKSNVYETELFFENIVSKPIGTKKEVEKLSCELEDIMKLPEATFMLSNLGIVGVPKQMKTYIKDFECTTSNTTLSTLYTMMTINNIGKLVITQNDDSKIIIEEIVSTFIKNGIKVQVEDYGKIRMDTVAPFKFERLG
ncbi:MAG: hypothetical protein IKG14_01555 [Clostridia bacterium]|nr:hypothetical protein [Clostridia bacterium]